MKSLLVRVSQVEVTSRENGRLSPIIVEKVTFQADIQDEDPKKYTWGIHGTDITVCIYDPEKQGIFKVGDRLDLLKLKI